MKSTSDIKRLQSVLLSIMIEIDNLCKRHGIKYYLNGGNALGAVRHGGFIPWDDDFDIMMFHSDYKKFLSVCREELDQNKWYIQEAWKDWPGCFSKIRLKGTYFEDVGEWRGVELKNRGIYIDIFEIVKSPNNYWGRRIQYTAAKLLNSYSLRLKGYKTQSLIKKIALGVSVALKSNKIRNFCKWLCFRGEDRQTNYVGVFFGQSRFKTAFYRKDVFQEPFYFKYENTELPLPTLYIEYLEQTFGDFMKLPPEDQQRPSHALKIDFGEYE